MSSFRVDSLVWAKQSERTEAALAVIVSGPTKEGYYNIRWSDRRDIATIHASMISSSVGESRSEKRQRMTLVKVGTRVAIFWDGNKAYYEGKIVSHVRGDIWEVLYDDGEKAQINFWVEEGYKILPSPAEATRENDDDDSMDEESASEYVRRYRGETDDSSPNSKSSCDSMSINAGTNSGTIAGTTMKSDGTPENEFDWKQGDDGPLPDPDSPPVNSISFETETSDLDLDADRSVASIESMKKTLFQWQNQPNGCETEDDESCTESWARDSVATPPAARAFLEGKDPVKAYLGEDESSIEDERSEALLSLDETEETATKFIHLEKFPPLLPNSLLFKAFPMPSDDLKLDDFPRSILLILHVAFVIILTQGTYYLAASIAVSISRIVPVRATCLVPMLGTLIPTPHIGSNF